MEEDSLDNESAFEESKKKPFSPKKSTFTINKSKKTPPPPPVKQIINEDLKEVEPKSQKEP